MTDQPRFRYQCRNKDVLSNEIMCSFRCSDWWPFLPRQTFLQYWYFCLPKRCFHVGEVRQPGIHSYEWLHTCRFRLLNEIILSHIPTSPLVPTMALQVSTLESTPHSPEKPDFLSDEQVDILLREAETRLKHAHDLVEKAAEGPEEHDTIAVGSVEKHKSCVCPGYPKQTHIDNLQTTKAYE